MLLVLDIDYSEYYEANSILNFLLGVSVVSLGYLLERQYTRVREKIVPILISTFIGSMVAVGSVCLILVIFGADRVILMSLQPKTVTMPIAVSISEHSGGLAPLVSLGVILAGISGSVLGPFIFRILGIHDRVARGLALGSASHAVGTARALEMGALEGAVGGVAVGLMGMMTALIIPLINLMLGF